MRGTAMTLLLAVVAAAVASAEMSWEPVATNAPRGRLGHSATLSQDKTWMLVFGGCTSSCCWAPVSDLYALNIASKQWQQLNGTGSSQLEGRVYHSSVSGASFAQPSDLIVFGGSNVNGYIQQLLAFSVAANKWSVLDGMTTGTAPRGRASHSAVIDTQGRMIVFGGNDENGFFADTFALDKSYQWKALQSTGPSARAQHSAVVTADNKMVVFGGQNATDNMNDVWILDLATGMWSELKAKSASVPRARRGHVAAMVSATEMLIYGGNVNDALSLEDTWVLTLATGEWHELDTTTQPKPRQSTVLCDGLLYAGFNALTGDLLEDVWRLH